MCKRKQKQKCQLRRIYKTTDGFFNNKPHIRKPRHVAVVYQRKMDGALAVVKIFSEEEKDGIHFVRNLKLSPKRHPALTKDSIVETYVRKGVVLGKNKYRPIYVRDLEPTGDKLSWQEFFRVRANAGGPTRKNRQTNRRNIRDWRNGFQK